MIRLLILMLFVLMPGALWASKVALVIGNSKYASVAELDNPQNDARAVSRALSLQGFDVIAASDLTRAEMRDTLRDFREMADRADVALVYYAGHGIEISGNNYLVPVDARLEDERDAELEMVELDLVLRQISGAKALKMVVLDACRNNPFVVKMKRSSSGRSIGSGLGRIEFAGADTLIAYAAAAGEITPDGVTGANSPFTQAFLTALEGPPTDVRRLLGRVRDNMRQSVPGAAPFVYTSLGGGEFVINPNSRADSPAPQAPGLSISEDFIQVDRSGSFQDWSDFLVRHEAESGHPLYAFALEKREQLRAAAGVPPRPTRVEPVEQTAALGTDETSLAPQRNPVAVAPVMSDAEAARRLQLLLRDAGCYGGGIDGILGRGSRAALTRFASVAGVAMPAGATEGGAALREAIGMVEDHPGAQCPKLAVVAPKPAPKPRSQPTVVRTAPAVAPVQPTVRTRPSPAPEPTTSYGRTVGADKFKAESVSDCMGPRKKFYYCE
ncbi:caspase family protein [Seohaeicola zhoushanensis]|uniref:Caspase family p20 domain-containing protein n=1 Tax=Seohaeicola zhoushanensis TaxID=1569283 RepID=A0A8J3GZL6_9RHOB|nr:caspase family protein [Seohaeicola zhoushanensis]GHF57477.1 hypothetical protein GCM10017056_31180 [Seohaeicola zhoushanensis]